MVEVANVRHYSVEVEKYNYWMLKLYWDINFSEKREVEFC